MRRDDHGHDLKRKARAIATPAVAVLAIAALAVIALGMRATRVLAREAMQPRAGGFLPGSRVLLDAHNAYPEAGKWADRIDSALATGTPLAIEQDLYWHRVKGKRYVSVVAHEEKGTGGAPTFEHYFFDRIAPIMERALTENKQETWPLVVLNLDFKTNERAHYDAIYALLGKYERWLTTATRTATPDIPEALSVGPLLVLSGQDSTQRLAFHDAIGVGQKLRVFGAIPVPAALGSTREERTHNLSVMPPDILIAPRASNYARWVNFPWGVVEEGGQNKAGEWTARDSVRLSQLVERAHANALWIRFYTLDGFTPSTNRGFTASYNFGSEAAARTRWNAVIGARVDFVATDQYGRFAEVLRARER